MKSVTAFLGVLFLLLGATSDVHAAAPTCKSAGAFASGSDVCCAGLVKDSNNRCQYPTCKKVGEAGVVQASGTSNCCFGLVLVSGVCRTPTLLASKCKHIGEVPGQLPCCAGLAKDTTGRCAPSGNLCSSTQIASCCYGKAVNTCACYCPKAYYL